MTQGKATPPPAPFRAGIRNPRRRVKVVRFLAAGFVLCCFGGRSALGQISPGELSRTHASLQGPLHCLDCHTVSASVKQLKCTECHVEIRQRLERQSGLHPRLVGAAAGDSACGSCHSEHNGEGFSLIHWDTGVEKFDHRKTGYWLEGRHAGVECRKCHKAENIGVAERGTLKVRDLNRTFLGLSTECRTCHADAHRGQLGEDCRRCHTYKGWKEALKFEHKMARFQLTGRHAQVACEKCHPRTQDSEGGSRVRFTGLEFANCTPCHADRHRGAFLNACSACHNTDGWKQIKLPATFDHSRTRFALQGKHAAVQCADCHRAGNFALSLSFQQCTDCHRTDPHRGQFAGRSDNGQCSACHTVDGFKPSIFNTTRHADSRFPLQGKHAAVQCAKCHRPNADKTTAFKFADVQCRTCHTDAHAGQFAGAQYANRCESCHSVQGFRPSAFTLARHTATRFPLTSGHAALPCAECHRTSADSFPQQTARYAFTDLTCIGCHTDPHQGQFVERMKSPRADGTAAGCEACHTLKSWKAVAGFDHATTRFALEGAHAGQACDRCHKAPGFDRRIQDIVFRSAPTNCSGCHDDIHGGQFQKAGQSQDCSRCHTSKRWRPSLFDHHKDSTYELEGSHREVPCNLCHTQIEDVAGRSTRVYRSTPRTCIACHGPETKKKS